MPPPPDTARLPPGVFGPLDQDVQATQYAQYAFADPARTYGNPVAGAQAVLAMDYIAGELNTSPRWANINALRNSSCCRAGPRPAPPWESHRMHRRNWWWTASWPPATPRLRRYRGGGEGPRQSGVPRRGPHTVQVLANLPYIQMANVSTQHAAEDLFRPDDDFHD